MTNNKGLNFIMRRIIATTIDIVAFYLLLLLIILIASITIQIVPLPQLDPGRSYSANEVVEWRLYHAFLSRIIFFSVLGILMVFYMIAYSLILKTKHQTIGKMISGIIILNKDGNQHDLTLSSNILRTFLSGLLGPLGFHLLNLVFIFFPGNRTFSDRISASSAGLK